MVIVGGIVLPLPTITGVPLRRSGLPFLELLVGQAIEQPNPTGLAGAMGRAHVGDRGAPGHSTGDGGAPGSKRGGGRFLCGRGGVEGFI